ncbi:MAG TPA: hypothetical protein VFT64_06455 [Rickettsiales bacterium]|nr:hypothetical protein [Rickettsiales bacterium]
MEYYIRTTDRLSHESKPTFDVWKIDHDSACRLGIHEPEKVAGAYFKAKSGETIWDTIRNATPWFEPHGKNPFHKVDLEPGQYYPRIARPVDQHVHESPGTSPSVKNEANSIAIACGQLDALTTQLNRICQTIHPSDKTSDAFGHDIRNLLILACTEIESHWRGILTANGYTAANLNTNDYVKLNKVMRLDEYAVVYPNYPWLLPTKPFEGWDIANPSRSLKWYDAYNAAKHDRENNFEQATLCQAFNAVTACGILIAGQYGLHSDRIRQSSLRSFFSFQEVPQWSLNEIYIYPYGAENWLPKNLAI